MSDLQVGDAFKQGTVGGATDQGIAAAPDIKEIVARAARQSIQPGPSPQGVVASSTHKRVVAGATLQIVIAQSPIQAVGPTVALDQVGVAIAHAVEVGGAGEHQAGVGTRQGGGGGHGTGAAQGVSVPAKAEQVVPDNILHRAGGLVLGRVNVLHSEGFGAQGSGLGGAEVEEHPSVRGVDAEAADRANGPIHPHGYGVEGWRRGLNRFVEVHRHLPPLHGDARDHRRRALLERPEGRCRQAAPEALLVGAADDHGQGGAQVAVASEVIAGGGPWDGGSVAEPLPAGLWVGRIPIGVPTDAASLKADPNPQGPVRGGGCQGP